MQRVREWNDPFIYDNAIPNAKQLVQWQINPLDKSRPSFASEEINHDDDQVDDVHDDDDGDINDSPLADRWTGEEEDGHQCNQILRNFTSSAKCYKSLVNFRRFISYLANY